MRLRNTAAAAIDTGDPDSDSDGASTEVEIRTNKRKPQSSSSSSLAEDGEKKRAHKRQRASVRRTSTTHEFFDHMKEANERREEHREVMDLLERQGGEMSSALNGFLELEKARFARDK